MNPIQEDNKGVTKLGFTEGQQVSGLTDGVTHLGNPGRVVIQCEPGATSFVFRLKDFLIFGALLIASRFIPDPDWRPATSFLVVMVCFAILVITQRRKDGQPGPDEFVIGDEKGIRYMVREMTAWEIPWAEIRGYTPHPNRKRTVIHTVDGVDRGVPFLISPKAPFESKKNALRQMLAAHGIEAGYSRAELKAPASPATLKLAMGLGIFGLVVLAIGIVSASYFDGQANRSVTDPALFSRLIFYCSGLQAIGASICVGTVPLALLLARDRRRALWASSHLQLGPKGSLYRQLAGIDPIAYGCYRYPDNPYDLDNADQVAFKLNWPHPEQLLTGTDNQVFWGPNGISIVPDGPIYKHQIYDQMDKEHQSGLVALVVTEPGREHKPSQIRYRLGLQEVGDVFDPRYLIRVSD